MDGRARRNEHHGPRASSPSAAWLFGSADDRLKKKRVALLMAGNLRTHDSCAPSIRKHLLEHKYNDRWRFEVVALAYKERFGKAIHRDAVSKTWTQGKDVTDLDIRKHYTTWPCHVKIVTAESVEKSIKKPPSPHFARFTHVPHARDTYVFMDSLGNFDGVVRFRFVGCSRRSSCTILNVISVLWCLVACLYRHARRRCTSGRTAAGHWISNGRLWVQDHVAYGGRTAMRAYFVDT